MARRFYLTHILPPVVFLWPSLRYGVTCLVKMPPAWQIYTARRVRLGRLHCFISLSLILGEEGIIFLIHLCPPSVLLCPTFRYGLTCHVSLPLTWSIHAAGRVRITTPPSSMPTLYWFHLAQFILYFTSLTFQTFVIGNVVVSDIRAGEREKWTGNFEKTQAERMWFSLEKEGLGTITPRGINNNNGKSLSSFF